MIFILKIGLRNLLRHKRRTFLTLLTMVAGFVLSSFAISMADGSYGQMIKLLTEAHSGHIQIHGNGYLEKPSIYNLIRDPQSVSKFVDRYQSVAGFSKRVLSYAIAFSEEKSSGLKLIGVDEKREAQHFRLPEKLSMGSYFNEGTQQKEALLGFSAARILKVVPGDDIFLISQGIDGSIANEQFRVIGIIGSDNNGYHAMSMITRLTDAQEFLSINDEIHEIAIILQDIDVSSVLSQNMARAYRGDQSLEFLPWEKVEEDFYKSMTADKRGNWISLVIIMIVVHLVECLAERLGKGL